MAIKAIIGFDHLPQNDVSWSKYVDHNITRSGNLASTTVISNGWITSVSPTAGSEGTLIPLTNYLLSPVDKLWFGVRVRIDSLINPAAGILKFGSSLVFRISDIPNAGNGTEAFLEISYTVSTGIIERWINNVKLANLTYSTSQRTAVLTLESKGTTANQVAWRDIAITDDQGASSGLPVSKLGDKSIIPITLTSAISSDWTTVPAGEPLLTVLGSVGELPTENYALSAKTLGSLTVGLQSAVPDGFIIMAMELTAGTCYVAGAGTGTSCAVALKQGSRTLVGKPATATWSVFNYSQSLGVFPTNPLGNVWDDASIAATRLTLTPDK